MPAVTNLPLIMWLEVSAQFSYLFNVVTDRLIRFAIYISYQ